MTQDEQDEIWLSHLRPNANKWVALVGKYPHALAGVGDDAVKAVADAERNGYKDVTLFFVPDPTVSHVVTPF